MPVNNLGGLARCNGMVKEGFAPSSREVLRHLLLSSCMTRKNLLCISAMSNRIRKPVEYPGGSRVWTVVESLHLGNNSLRLGSNSQKPLSCNYLLYLIQTMELITSNTMNSENSAAHQAVRLQDAQEMYYQGQIGRRKDAAVIAQMAPSTFIHRMAGWRSAEDYGKHGGF